MLIRAATAVQQLCKSCRTCFMFYCMFYFTCDRFLRAICRTGNHQQSYYTFTKRVATLNCIRRQSLRQRRAQLLKSAISRSIMITRVSYIGGGRCLQFLGAHLRPPFPPSPSLSSPLPPPPFPSPFPLPPSPPLRSKPPYCG